MDDRRGSYERVEPDADRRLSLPFASPRSLRLDLACVALLFSGITIGGFGLVQGLAAKTGADWFPLILGGPTLATWILAADRRAYPLVMASAVLATIGAILMHDGLQFVALPVVAAILLGRSREEFRR